MARTPVTVTANIPSSGNVTLFTVAAGERYVVRHIRIQESAGATATATVAGTGTGFGTQLNFWMAALTAASTNGSYLDYWGQTAFAATSTLVAAAPSGAYNIVVDYDRYIL